MNICAANSIISTFIKQKLWEKKNGNTLLVETIINLFQFMVDQVDKTLSKDIVVLNNKVDFIDLFKNTIKMQNIPTFKNLQNTDKNWPYVRPQRKSQILKRRSSQ